LSFQDKNFRSYTEREECSDWETPLGPAKCPGPAAKKDDPKPPLGGVISAGQKNDTRLVNKKWNQNVNTVEVL
jgi:hypothetical protein